MKELKDELESMKNVIAHTIEDELKTKSEISMKESANNMSPEFSKLLWTLGLDKNPVGIDDSFS